MYSSSKHTIEFNSKKCYIQYSALARIKFKLQNSTSNFSFIHFSDHFWGEIRFFQWDFEFDWALEGSSLIKVTTPTHFEAFGACIDPCSKIYWSCVILPHTSGKQLFSQTSIVPNVKNRKYFLSPCESFETKHPKRKLWLFFKFS